MYTYEYGIGRYRDYRPGAHLVDISKIPLKSLNKYFTILDIVLYDGIYKRNIKITLDHYVGTFSKLSETIEEWLENNPTIVLDYTLDIPENTKNYALWESLSHKGFYPHPGNINLSNDRQEKLTAEAAPDIRILRDNYDYTDYGKLADYALFIMNGYFVRAVGNSTGLYLRNAGKDYQANKEDIYVSAINMEKIGKLETIPITSSMLRHDYDSDGRQYFIDMPVNTSLEDKTIWIVFNGQLLTDTDIISKVTPDTLLLNMGNVDAMTHYITYRKRTRTPVWSNQDKDRIYLYNALCADNSFVVLIDNPLVGIDIEPTTTFKYPINHHTNDKFNHPVMLENGLFPYCLRRTYGNEARIINTDISALDRPVINSVGRLSDPSVFTGKNAGDPGTLPRAYLFKIFGVGK